MPSPTSSTRPTSRVSTCVWYWSISDCRTETISSALNLMATSFDELFPEGFQLGANRAVEQPVAHAHFETADQVRVDLSLQDGLEMKGAAQLLEQAPALVVRQR